MEWVETEENSYIPWPDIRRLAVVVYDDQWSVQLMARDTDMEWNTLFTVNLHKVEEKEAVAKLKMLACIILSYPDSVADFGFLEDRVLTQDMMKAIYEYDESA